MATGSGKTLVMAMIIAWQALNKLHDRQDARVSDAFLIVTPGITIRDRLRVLLPTDPDNYYRQRDILPPGLLERLAHARVVITNFHGFLPRERGDAARLTKRILTRGERSPFIESPAEVVRRVCRDLAGKKQIVVINAEAQARGLTPPVFVVVCANTNISKLVFDYVAGWEKHLGNGQTARVPGQLPLFSNVDGERWRDRPNTMLIDSRQIESGEGMSPEFKKIAAVEIEEFKAEYRARFPGRDADALEDEDLLREVMNTVGKPGKLGEHIRCVVSVSMLTEGWDANTVTHILGVRAFGTQLLCEQVVGRGLRRMSYATNENGLFEAEYAEVYGVPFSFIPTSGSGPEPRPPRLSTRVRALDDRRACENGDLAAWYAGACPARLVPLQVFRRG
jgi:hypothetical protein